MSFNLKSKIQNLKSGEYQCLADLNLYDSPECTRLATQAAVGRHLRITSNDNDVETRLMSQRVAEDSRVGGFPDLSELSVGVPTPLASSRQSRPTQWLPVVATGVASLQVCLCEDDYPGWVSLTDLSLLQSATVPYEATAFSQSQIKKLLAEVIVFTQKAMQQANYYLWGGTVAPNYDCSGLMQAAFASVGIWIPRDAYQQEEFTQPISTAELEAGDLVFFGTPEKATHVGLYLADGYYIHSSGKDKGRNGIAIDCLTEQGDAVSQSYYQQLRGAGRVVKSYEPQRR